MSFKLIWDERSKADMSQIWNYIALDSPGAANTFVENINKTAKRLKSDPFLGPEEPLLKKHKLGHRYIIYSHYKIIYRIQQDQIFVAAIFDTRQKPSKIKKIVKKTN